MTTPEDAIAAVLRPDDGAPAHPLTSWLARVLARETDGVERGEADYFAAPRFADGTRHVWIPHAITCDAHVAAALHEAGHCADKIADPLSIAGEVRAWVWAAWRAGRRWSRPMQEALEQSVGSYGAGAVVTDGERQLVREMITLTRALVRQSGVVYREPRPPLSVFPMVYDCVKDIVEVRYEEFA